MIKATHKPIQEFLKHRDQLSAIGITNEGGVSSAFFILLQRAAPKGWSLVPQETLPKSKLRPDGTLKDDNGFRRGYWEAKDGKDDLDKEIEKKRALGYPTSNIIYEDSRNAVLIQNRGEVLRVPLSNAQGVADLLNNYFDYTEPHIEEFEKAVDEFKDRVPDLAKGLLKKIEDSHKSNREFRDAFASFHELCKTSLNPGLRQEAVEEMLVQHLLTERLIGNIFDNPEFRQRNVIAAEIEKVIQALTGKHFNRQQYMEGLNRFYMAIEGAAKNSSDFSEKQHLLNSVYERFFQGYAVKVADTHGIVYTPQPIVDFMCASVVEVLKSEFGKELGDPDVCIIDPCTGTGNFIVNLLRRIPQKDLPRMYKSQLFANEVMLMPYYIAALNIEHAYFEITGKYEPFEGLCFVDTLGMAEAQQQALFTEKNVERVERQKKAPITIVIGNPPYNAKQLNENDNNGNRSYKEIDSRVQESYSKDSRATNRISLSDPYVKFFRWATDRLESRDGVVCYISNNSFVDQIAFDGMRKHLSQDFDTIYHADLHGNVRQNPKLSGTTHNVFGIQVGVGITVGVKKKAQKKKRLNYYRVPEFWRKEEKYDWLNSNETVKGVKWDMLTPDAKYNWILAENADEFAESVPIGSKEAKSGSINTENTLFIQYTRGIVSCRDFIVMDSDRDVLEERIGRFVEEYNSAVSRWQRSNQKVTIDDFTSNSKVDWSLGLKNNLKGGKFAEYKKDSFRKINYRPFNKRWHFYDSILNEALYRWPHVYPLSGENSNNIGICVSGIGHDVFQLGITDAPCELKYSNSTNGGTQCFPFYVYNEDGSGRRENITDWALGEFRGRYGGAIAGVDTHNGGEGAAAKKSVTPGKILQAADGLQDDKAKKDGLQDDEADRHDLQDDDTKKSGAIAGVDTHNGGKGVTAKKGGKPGKILQAADGLQDDKAKKHGEITKWDIFYYVYGMLHSPEYRARYADNLKRELPRIPFAPDFWAFSTAGKQLSELHLKYEESKPYKLKFVETPKTRMTYRVEKMRLQTPPGPPVNGGGSEKAGRTGGTPAAPTNASLSVKVNETLTLSGIPAEVLEYRLGNRSALEWVIDQYQIKTDKRSGITHDPNREDDEEYIVRLIGQVVQVSLETVRIVKGLPREFREASVPLD